jgi:hypothetical protein
VGGWVTSNKGINTPSARKWCHIGYFSSVFNGLSAVANIARGVSAAAYVYVDVCISHRGIKINKSKLNQLNQYKYNIYVYIFSRRNGQLDRTPGFGHGACIYIYMSPKTCNPTPTIGTY